MFDLAQFDLPGLSGTAVGRAPAGAGVAIDGVAGEVVLVLFFSAGLGRASERDVAFTTALGDNGVGSGGSGSRCDGQGGDRGVGFLVGCPEVLPGIPAAGPQQAAGQHVEVGRFDHRLVVVPDGGRKDAGIVIAIGPDTDLGFAVASSFGMGQWRGGVE